MDKINLEIRGLGSTYPATFNVLVGFVAKKYGITGDTEIGEGEFKSTISVYDEACTIIDNMMNSLETILMFDFFAENGVELTFSTLLNRGARHPIQYILEINEDRFVYSSYLTAYINIINKSFKIIEASIDDLPM